MPSNQTAREKLAEVFQVALKLNGMLCDLNLDVADMDEETKEIWRTTGFEATRVMCGLRLVQLFLFPDQD